MGFMARRRGVVVEPVTAKSGVRYEVYGGYPEFERQRGVVAAFDAANDERLWAVLVYSTAVDPKWESDVQDVFITELRLDADETKLVVVNERKRSFVIDLASHAVSELTES
jgi:tricorn protease-like protein